MSAQSNVAPTIIKRKKVVAGDGHHGGAWKVAYADFVTAMMAFFMMMWLLNATTEKQRSGIADYFTPTVPINRQSGGGEGMFNGNTIFSEDVLTQVGTGASQARPTEANRARGQMEAENQGASPEDNSAFRQIEEALFSQSGESMVSDALMRHIITRVTDEGLVIELFDLERATLFEEGTDEPTQLMRDLAAMIQRVSGLVTNQIAVGGHVRANPVVQATNPVWSLSAARADRMRTLLKGSGMSSDRIRRVTGHADRTPVARDPMAIRNNRVEVIFLRR